jgi:hypothetical protein
MLRRRPSPAMVVATIALFIAMSGTTYAVTKLPKNSVGSTQLRANAVQTSDIKDGAVTASKLANGALPGQTAAAPDRVGYADRAGFASRSDAADRATFADSAGRSTSATGAGFADNADRLDGKDSSAFLPRGLVVEVQRFSLTDGQQREVLHHGPFTVTAHCDTNVTTPSGVIDSADMLVSATQENSVMDGFTLNPDLDPDDPPSERVLISVSPPDGTPDFESSADGTLVAPDGTEIRSAVLHAGVNIHGQPNKCFFGGFFVI